MIHPFKASYAYDEEIVNNWESDAIGVYYCGAKTIDDKLRIYYVGRAIGDGGIRARLLQHLQESKWYDVTHFGYCVCDAANEAIDLEASEIALYSPKYNTIGV
jgi:excinuclease UvrABC nuclease subunit